jgi:hypothetical protein
MHLYLHIGTAKTGTTTLQHFLYTNRAQLAAQGVALLDSAGAPNARVLAAFAQPAEDFDHYFLSRGITDVAGKKRHFADFPARLKAELAHLPQGTRAVLASSEHLHARLCDDASLQRLRDLLLQVGITRITMICYFREQSAQALSRYSTRLMAGAVETLDDLLREYTEDSPLWNYHLACNRWAKVFGYENLRARAFLPALFHDGDLRRDFLAQLPEITRPELLDYSQEAQNRSLGHVGQALALTLNRTFPRYTAEGRNNDLRSRLYRVIADSPLGRRGVTPFPQAPAIHARFADSNAALGRDFLGLGGSPFAPPAPPVAGSAYPGALSEEEQALISEAQALFAETCAVAAGTPDVDSARARALRELAERTARAMPKAQTRGGDTSSSAGRWSSLRRLLGRR